MEEDYFENMLDKVNIGEDIRNAFERDIKNDDCSEFFYNYRGNYLVYFFM